MEKTNEIHLKKQISFRLSSRPLFCIVENENNTFDQRYMWNTLTIVGSCINLASGKLFVLSWRQNDKKSICFRYYRKTRFEIKRYDTNFIYNKNFNVFSFLKKPFIYSLMQILVIIVNLDIVFLETDDAYWCFEFWLQAAS